MDARVAKCFLDRGASLNLGLESAFNTFDLCNPEKIFSIAKRKLGDFAVVNPVSECVLRNASAMLDPSYAMVSTITVHDTIEVMYGINLTLAVIMTSLLGGNSVSNSQLDERLTRSLVWLMMRDVPSQFCGQDGNQFLRKNFRGNCPSSDFNVLDGYNDPRPAYIARPKHDHEKSSNRMTHFSCTVYRSFAPEDLAHMSELAALTKKYGAYSILDVSLTHSTPRYMFLYNTRYAIAFTQEGSEIESKRLGKNLTERVRGHLFIASPKQMSSASVAANTTPWKIRYYGEHGEFHDVSGLDVSEIDGALAARHSVVMPLIRRHNAVVYCTVTKAFGVVLPIQTEPRESFSGDTYFDMNENCWGYNIAMENHEISEDTMSIDALTMQTSVVALASKIYIRGDVYLHCRGNNPRHADCPRATSSSNKKQTSLSHQYIEAVIAYPSKYPSKVSQIYSIYAEVEYSASKDSEQSFYEPLEINLESIRAANLYSVHEKNTPLMREDPRVVLGDDISIISFTRSGYR